MNIVCLVMLVMLTYFAVSVENAKILGIFHMPSYSHHIAGKTLLKALAKRGHQVTMISTFPLKSGIENYEDIYVPELIKFKNEGAIKIMIEAESASILRKVQLTSIVITKMNEICLSDKSVQSLLSSDRTFDLVIMDWIFTDSMLGIAHHFKAPVIAMSAAGSTVLTNKVTGNPSPFSYVPNLYFTGSDKMGLIDRVANTISTIIFELNEYLVHEPIQNELLHRFFPNAPHVAELIQNVSLILINSHLSIESPRPYVPNMIQVGGIHVGEPQILDASLQKFMDEATDGVVYFSLGGNAKSEDLPKEKLESIIKTFAKLPVKVLWKFEAVEDFKLPSNVRTEKWIPQSDVLAHPNMKAFVSQGGLLSITEAVYRGVPMVGIPIFAEQELNVKNAVEQGYAKMVKVNDLNEETLFAAINKVLENPKYRENMQKRSSWLKDQPVNPLDKAIFWVEYVLRHKGAPHLKTNAVSLKWYQYYLVDVALLLLALGLVIFLTCIVVLWKVITLVTKRLLRRKQSRKSKENRKKKQK